VLAKNGEYGVIIPYGDLEFHSVAARHGMITAQEKDSDAVFLLDLRNLSYTLPDGFCITSMRETYEWKREK